MIDESGGPEKSGPPDSSQNKTTRAAAGRPGSIEERRGSSSFQGYFFVFDNVTNRPGAFPDWTKTTARRTSRPGPGNP